MIFNCHTVQRNAIDLWVFSEINFRVRSNDCEDNIMMTPASKNEYSAHMKESTPQSIKINYLDEIPKQKSLPNIFMAKTWEFENELLAQTSFKVKSERNKNHKHTKYPKRLNLASRSDVVNKCSIRKLRRHFWTLFRVNNK